MSEYVKLATGVGDLYLTALAEFQESVLKSMTAFADAMPTVRARRCRLSRRIFRRRSRSPRRTSRSPRSCSSSRRPLPRSSSPRRRRRRALRSEVPGRGERVGTRRPGRGAPPAPRSPHRSYGWRHPGDVEDARDVSQSFSVRPAERSNMATEAKAENEPTLVEQWLKDQQQWQRTLLAFLDSAVKNDDFLAHLGNAMRGSLLAGKPYPTAAAPGAPAPETPADDRLDQVLFALHQLQGRVEDLFMTLEEIRQRSGGTVANPAVRSQRLRSRRVRSGTSGGRRSKTRKRRVPG